jgi:hypothetical protein
VGATGATGATGPTGAAGATGAGSLIWMDGVGQVTAQAKVGIGGLALTPTYLLEVSGPVTQVVLAESTLTGSVGVLGKGAVGVRGTSFGATGVGVSGIGPVYGLFAGGNLGASGTKSFVQPHPTNPAKEIRYVCLEGNEAGTYFRGTAHLVNGVAEIEIPEDFSLVTDPEGITVQVTAVGMPAALYVAEQGLSRIVVRGAPDATFHYFVNGVRRGYTNFEPIQDNVMYVPESAEGIPFAQWMPAELRQLLIDNGTLNSDLTRNERTARTLGWLDRELGAPQEVGPRK